MMRPPKVFDSILNNVGRYTNHLCPLARHHLLPMSFYQDGISPVSDLFFKRNPLTIFWAVVAVYVFAFNRVPHWHRPHVCQEILKAMSSEPPIAYHNTATTIIAVSRTAWIKAPRLHVVIGFILSAFLTAASCAMRERTPGGNFIAKAAAAFGLTSLKIASSYDNNGSALAAAFPQLTTSCFCSTEIPKHDKPSKGMAGSVYEKSACRNRVIGSHETFLRERMFCGESRTGATNACFGSFIIAITQRIVT